MSLTVSSYQHPWMLYLHPAISHVCNNCIRPFVMSLTVAPNQQSCLLNLHLRACMYTRTKTHKKHYHYEKISPLFFFSAVYNKTHVIPQYTSCYFCHLGRHLGYLQRWNTTTSCQSNSRMQLLLKTIRKKKVINCDSDFKWDCALKWRPFWTPS